ncbi:hypothetical protein [Rubritalea tangerina]|uniref:Integral membrane protein n=1 Tax=Rubritalea tangerina TaxID=430798 RepID=A0ABW4Z7D9_9BACT
MTEQVIVYVVYTLVSIGLTIWVANTLHKNGRVFLLEAFRGDEERADAVNHLLKVGFYLINVGFVLLFLKYGQKPEGFVGAIEFCATKLGFVTLVLGGMHFFNMYNFDKMRKKGRIPQQTDYALAGK